MSDNKKFRIQNGVDVTGELSINDVVVIDANGKVVPEAISEAISGSTSSDIAALQAQVSAILGTSPETLDTLQEIVASFQDADSNIVTTVSTNTTAIADMQPQVSTNTAAIAAANARTSGISTSSGSSNIQMSAEVDMDGNKVTNMGEPTDGSDAATKDYVDVKSQLAVTTGATDKTELLAAIAAETNRATVVESTLQTNIDSLSDDKDSDIAQEITNRTTADALLQAQIDAEESARTIQDASLDSKITSEATRAVAAELGLQQSINDITSGTSEFTGDLIPNQDNVHSLGSETRMWKDVYVGPGSLYINGQKVIEDNSGTITVNADPGQNLSLNTSGGGAIDLNSGAESVQIRSDLVISSSKTISTTGGAPTKFGGDVDMQGNTLGNVAEPVNDNDAVTKAWFESYVATPHTGSKTFVDDVVIQGNLTVSGSTITVNSETMSVADNMVDLNSNMTSGTPTENAGIRVMRGDQSPKTFLWNEANDQWTAEGPLKADSFVGDGSGLSGMYGEADVTALVDSAYVQSRQSSSVSHATQADNADTLDGINSTSFARSDLGNIWEPTSINTFKSTGASNLHSQSSLQVYNGTGEDAFMTFHVANDFAVNFGLDASTNDLFVGGWSMAGPYKIWHEGNASLGDVAELTLKLSPTSTGIDVTGSVTADGLTVSAPSGDTPVSIVTTTAGSFLSISDGNTTSGRSPLVGAITDAMVFYTSAGSYNERMRIDASGNVGIGTPSPVSKLHAYTASGNNIVRSESGDNYAAFQTLASGTNSGYIFFNNASGETGRITSANGGTMVFSNNGTQERMRITSAGNVSIGTTADATKLFVYDSTTSKGITSQTDVNASPTTIDDEEFISFAAITADANLTFSGGDARLMTGAVTPDNTIVWRAQNIGLLSTDSVKFFTAGGAERMRIDSGGNVGIGTTSPSYTVSSRNDSAISYPLSLESATLGTAGNTVGMLFGYAGNTYQKGAVIFESVDSNARGKMHFALDNSAGSGNVQLSDAKMTIDYAGNVGIGTLSPSALLDISGAVYSTLNLTSQHGYALNRNWKFTTNDFGSDNWGGISLKQSTSAGGDPTVHRFGITRDGNVGIGTNSPSETLTLDGDSLTTGTVFLGPNSGSRRPFAKASNWGYSSSYRVAVLGSASNSYNTDITGSTTISFNYDPSDNPNASFGGDGREIIFRNGTQFVTPNDADNDFNLYNLVLKDGNVGIGVSSPSAKLHLGTTGSEEIGIGLQNSQRYYGIQTTGGALTVKDVSAGGTERMRIDASGHVGIGTSSPQSIAAGYGALTVGGSTGGGINFNSTGSAFAQMYANTSGFVMSALGNRFMLFSTNGSERARIDTIGNLLVGTTDTDPSNNSTNSTADNGVAITAVGEVRSSRYLATTNSGAVCLFNRTGTDGAVVRLRRSGTTVGNISVTTSATSYNTSSDYRLKENVVPLTGATERVKQLNPTRFNFIADADTTVDGFLAHEVADVVPEAITGTKDAMLDEEYEVTPAVYEEVVIPAVLDEEGNEVEAERTEQQLVSEAVMATRSVPDYQGIDQSKLVPLLVATIQELEARIAALESK